MPDAVIIILTLTAAGAIELLYAAPIEMKLNAKSEIQQDLAI